MQITCAVYPRRLVNRTGNSIEKALLNQISHRRSACVNKGKSYMIVDKAELRHKKIYCRHAHKGRKHSENQRALHQNFTPRKLKRGNCKSRQYYQ